MARTIASLKKNTQFQALVAVLGDESKAKIAFDRLNPPAPQEDERVAQLVEAGFTKEQAEAALADAEAPAAEPETEKDKVAALVASKGFTFTKGRVYVTTDLIEAQARVMRSGKAEVVQSSGVGRTKAVLVTREESGDVALQNLTAVTA